MGKTEPTKSSENWINRNLHLQFSKCGKVTMHLCPCINVLNIDTWKARDPNFEGVINLKFFHMINIYEVVAIFQFFHNGQHWYSISVDTWKTGDPIFGGSVIWNFSVWSIFMKWQPFFNFFIMADTDILFPLTFILGHLCVVTFLTQKTRDVNFPLIQFSPSPILGSISTFKTFMCGDLSALKKTEMWIFHWFSFPNFPLVWLSPSPFLSSISMLKTFMHGHLCVVTFLHLESRDVNFPLIQFSELSIGSVFPITHLRFCFNV